MVTLVRPQSIVTGRTHEITSYKDLKMAPNASLITTNHTLCSSQMAPHQSTIANDARIYVARPLGMVGKAKTRQLSALDYTNILTCTRKELDSTSQVVKNMLFLQAGDVPATAADVDDLMVDAGLKPNTTIEAGIGSFVEWYRKYYNDSLDIIND